MAQRQTQGRRKIEMKKIQKDDDLLITFSKRRVGIYKKVTEISTLCGAEVGVLVFSPAGKPFTYGIPDIETIVGRFLGRNVSHNVTSPIVEAHRDAMIKEYNKTYNELSAHLEGLKKKGEMLAEMKREVQEDCWWDVPVEDLTPNDVQQFRASMEELKRVAQQKINGLLAMGASSSSVSPSSMPAIDPMQMNYQYPNFSGASSSVAPNFGYGFGGGYGNDPGEGEGEGDDGCNLE